MKTNKELNKNPQCTNKNCIDGIITYNGQTGRKCKICNPKIKQEPNKNGICNKCDVLKECINEPLCNEKQIHYTEEEVKGMLSKLAIYTTCEHCDEPYNWDLLNPNNFLEDWFEKNKKK